MATTIDAGGRLVIPKAVRDALGLVPGVEVEITVRDGTAQIAPKGAAMRLVRRGKAVAAEADRELPALSAAAVRDALEATRR